jgi:hypothetical protein
VIFAAGVAFFIIGLGQQRRATSERLTPGRPASSTMRRLSASLKLRRWPSRAGGMMSVGTGAPLVI